MQLRLRPVLLAVTALVLIGLVATPWLIGRNVRALAVTNPLELLPPEVRTQVTILDNNVSSGWLRSDIELAVRFQPLGEQAIELHTTMNVQHGPLLFTPTGVRLGLIYADIVPLVDSAALNELRAELPFELPELQVNFLLDLRNALQVNVAVAPVSYSGADGQLNFTGIQAQLLTFADMSAEFTLQMERLAAQEAGTAFEFNIENLEFTTRTEKVYDLLASSSSLFSIASINSPSPYPVSITNFIVNTRIEPSPEDEARTNIFQRMSIDALNTDLPVSAVNWTSEINDVRSDLLRRYYELAVQIQTEMDNNGGNITQQASQAGEELALLLLQNRLAFNNSVTATVYEGEHNIDLRILWHGLPAMRNIFALDLNAAMAAIEITLDLSLDLDAVTRSPAADLIDSYIQAGLIELDAGRIISRATFANSELTVNGESMALDNLFQIPDIGNQ